MIETEQQKKERKHREDLQRLREFRPIDDTFMRGLFKDNIPLAELVLRVIIGKPDLKLISCETQADMKRVTGARSICLDAYACDSDGKKYDIEIQRSDNGASPQRARYHSSVIDVENLDERQDYTALPDTYVIFITEKDYYKAGKPMYVIQNMNMTLGTPFNDGTHILYVNGEYRDDSEIGRLMHDFNCTNADEMNFSLLADKTRYLKENPRGVSEMCEAMEKLRYESYTEGLEEGIIKGIEEGRVKGIEEGRVKGMEEGRVKGMEEGRVKGIEEGRVKGIEEGRVKGMEEGRVKGMEEGRVKGIEEGRVKGMEEGRVKGIEQGLAEGKIEQAKSMVIKLHKKGYSLEDIADLAGFDVSTVREWLAQNGNK